MIVKDRVYISGPITNATKEQRQNFDKLEEALRKAHFEPLNPKSVSPCANEKCRKLPHEEGLPHSWSCYMRHDMVELLKCEYILMLPGWMDSHGAREEHHLAMVAGIPELYFLDGDLCYVEDGQTMLLPGCHPGSHNEC